jgi:hypothetical protein
MSFDNLLDSTAWNGVAEMRVEERPSGQENSTSPADSVRV